MRASSWSGVYTAAFEVSLHSVHAGIAETGVDFLVAGVVVGPTCEDVFLVGVFLHHVCN